MPLNLTASTADTDGSEVMTITVNGVPAGVELSAGIENPDGSWSLTQGDLANLRAVMFGVTAEAIGALNLTIDATTTESSTGSSATGTTTVSAATLAAGTPIAGLSVSENVVIVERSDGTTVYIGDSAANDAEVVISNLSLVGSQSLAFENVLVVIDGDMTVDDTASLRIANSEINLNFDFTLQHTMNLLCDGHLEIENTVVQPAAQHMRWRHRENATVDINGQRTSNSTDFLPIWQSVSDNASIAVNGSDVGLTVIPLVDG